MSINWQTCMWVPHVIPVPILQTEANRTNCACPVLLTWQVQGQNNCSYCFKSVTFAMVTYTSMDNQNRPCNPKIQRPGFYLQRVIQHSTREALTTKKRMDFGFRQSRILILSVYCQTHYGAFASEPGENQHIVIPQYLWGTSSRNTQLISIPMHVCSSLSHKMA